MHEMSVAQSLIDIIRNEMDKNAVTTLQTVKVKAGRINAIVPEAL
ncbi:MAG: hydrogenase maturation nickel metallochaperone HypA, partial [Desulfohalobiaceae bacterium]|nr:hydrogenase maturation nickel metallochaperone HypA [Desulfohalobiaceae bacterium]